MSRLLLLIDFYWIRDKDPRISLGHASLLASLKNVSDLKVVPISSPVNEEIDLNNISKVVMEHVSTYSPEFVDIAIGVYVWSEDIVRELLPLLKSKGFDGRIILGGPQISYSQPGLERAYPEADIFVRGYAEDVLAKIVCDGESANIKGVHYCGREDKGEQADVNLDKLSSPWLQNIVPLVDQKFIRWETQRGCPFQCYFCQHREPGSRLRHREFNRRRLFEEIKLFCRNNIKEIAVLDPIFNINSRATEILNIFYELGYKGQLSLQCRAEFVTPEFIGASKRLNVKLEFGLQTVHRIESKAIGRLNNLSVVNKVLNMVREAGIFYEISLIFGLPCQTTGSFFESVSWCLERKVPVIKAFPLMLLKGTKLDVNRERWNLKESDGSMPIVISSDSFNQKDWIKMAQLSEALKITEGFHPHNLDSLLRLSESCKLDLSRWMPEINEHKTWKKSA